jgi:hypothetical protein
VQSYHNDPQFEALFKLLSALGIRDAHLRALDGKPTYLVDIQSAFDKLIGPVDTFDLSRLKTEPALRGHLRSAVLTQLQAQVIFCWFHHFFGYHDVSFCSSFTSHWLIIRVSVLVFSLAV